jgi:hypothetical protein
LLQQAGRLAVAGEDRQGGSGGFGGSFYDSGTSTFTITAIPEASTSVAAIGLAGLLLSSWVRRRTRTA